MLLCALLLAGCRGQSPAEPSGEPSQEPSAEPSKEPVSDDPVSSDPSEDGPALQILSFAVQEYPDAPVTIDQENSTIAVIVPKGAPLSALTVVFTLPEGITSSPESGSVADLSKPLKIFLAAPSGEARKYTVTASEAPYTGTRLLQLICEDFYTRVYVKDHDVHLSLPFGTDLSAVRLTSVLSEGATGSPEVADAREPFIYTVTAEDGVHKEEYLVTITLRPQDKGVRGVFLPDPSHTSSFMSRASVQKSMALLKELNFNCLYVCAWARSKAAWDSEVLLGSSTYGSLSQGNLYASDPDGDALEDIISEAHKAGIKVILWFEYGFMHSAGAVNWNDPVLAAHPSWMGLGKDGKPASYNGTDFYYNAYDPEVRTFMLDLMEEALTKYPEVDGIQGDDRMPAMPRESGYNPSTVALYVSQTGNSAPTDDRDEQWSRWRLDILDGFAAQMAALARSKGKIISFAPNKYPWCESVLMQNWPAWVQAGNVDILNVQLYITGRYESDLADTLPYVGDAVFSPCMILKNGSAIMDPQMVADEWYANREGGTGCESQFWFDGLLQKNIQDVFKVIYADKAIWPL